MRPTTGPTAYVDDLVGAFVPRGRRPLLDAAYEQQRVAREGDPEWRDDIPVRVEAIPVRRGDRVLAVIARNTNLLGRAHAQPAGADLPADRHRPRPDDRATALPVPGPALRPRRLAAGRATASCGSTPPGGSPTPARTRCRSTAGSGWPRDLAGQRLADVTRGAGPAGAGARTRRRSAPCSAAGCPRDTEIGTDEAVADPARHPAAAGPASTSARWCCCATSPSCAAGTGSWSPRTPPSGRSTTG